MTGTPSNGPIGRPARQRCALSPAATRARGFSTAKALTLGLCRAIRSVIVPDPYGPALDLMEAPDGLLPETVEIPDHPWFIGVQYHPELKSRPFEPHPLFASFIAAAKAQSRLV